MIVPRKRIGRTGPEVSVLSLGSWHTYDRMDFHAGVELLRRAVGAGINFFDVGVYGGVPLPGTDGPVHYSFTDVIFGRLVQAAGLAREQYVLSVKLWLEGWPEHPMARQLDRALVRIGTDRAEFAVLGDIRTQNLDMDRLVGELAGLTEAGRLGAWGVNNWPVADISRACGAAAARSVPGPQLAQLKYSPCRRAIADGEPFRALFAETGLSLEASDVFEGGILAGHPSPARPIGRDPGDLRAAILAAAPAVARIAAEFGASPAQLVIAFCLGHPHLATVLFGVSRLAQLEENLAALDLFEREGAAIREKAAGLCVDAGVVDPAGA